MDAVNAAAMKDAHAAAAYTKWLNAEVQEALDDTSPTIPHDEAMRQVRAAIKRAEGACTLSTGKNTRSTT